MSNAGLSISKTQDVTVVAFRDMPVLDITTSQSMAKQILRLAQGPPAPRVLVDFSGVRFIASRMLGILVELTKKAGQAGGKVVVCGLQGDVSRIFRVMRLDRMLTVADTSETAMGIFSAGGDA